MATAVTINGVVYQQPDDGTPPPWGDVQATIIAALASSTLQKSGGTFTLTADAYFGATYGLRSQYYKGPGANPATTGSVRLGNAETVSWRNSGNSANASASFSSANEFLLDAGTDTTLIVQSNAGDAVLALRGNQASSNTWYLRNANSDSDTFKLEYDTLVKAFITTTGDLSLRANATPATAGALRIPNDVAIAWRNAGNSDNLELKASVGNQLVWGSVNLAPLTTNGDLYTYAGGTSARLGIGSNGQVLTVTGGAPVWGNVAGTGDVTGPASSTDNAIPRYDGTSGKNLQGSGVTIDDSNNVTFPANAIGTRMPYSIGTSIDSIAGNRTSYVGISGEANTAVTMRIAMPRAGSIVSKTLSYNHYYVSGSGMTCDLTVTIRKNGSDFESFAALPLSTGGIGGLTETDARGSLTFNAGDSFDLKVVFANYSAGGASSISYNVSIEVQFDS